MIRNGWRRFRAHNSPSAVAPVKHASKDLLKELLRKTPGAVRAQLAMDEQPQGYHTNKARLYELIDFNDSFVDLALALTHEERRGFIERLRVAMTTYCKEQRSPMFTDEQFDAITRGLSREVAVYLGAKATGFEVAMTSRTQDAMGVDMVIRDPLTDTALNIDCKTASAYHFRVKDLVSQGRMTKQQAIEAEELGYAHEVNGQHKQAVAVTLLRIDPNEVGDIVDFEFKSPELLQKRLRTIFDTAI